MNQIPKEMLESQKSTLEAMMAVQGTVFSGFEKLVDLNLKVMKATMDEASQKTQEAMGVKDAQEAVAMTSGLVQPSLQPKKRWLTASTFMTSFQVCSRTCQN